MPTKYAAWNTGAFYSAEGQRMMATIINDKCVFVDVDRMIDGVIDCPNPHLLDTQGEIARFVMRNYLYSQYRPVSYSVNAGEYQVREEMKKLGYDEFMSAHNLSPVAKWMQS